MPELKVSISETTHQTLLTMVEDSGETIQSVLDQAIENYRRSIFLTRANQAFTALRQNETLWQEEISTETIMGENYSGRG
jgi:lipopolysaccharide biosynthesis regulator YciM